MSRIVQQTVCDTVTMKRADSRIMNPESCVNYDKMFQAAYNTSKSKAFKELRYLQRDPHVTTAAAPGAIDKLPEKLRLHFRRHMPEDAPPGHLRCLYAPNILGQFASPYLHYHILNVFACSLGFVSQPHKLSSGPRRASAVSHVVKRASTGGRLAGARPEGRWRRRRRRRRR